MRDGPKLRTEKSKRKILFTKKTKKEKIKLAQTNALNQLNDNHYDLKLKPKYKPRGTRPYYDFLCGL